MDEDIFSKGLRTLAVLSVSLGAIAGATLVGVIWWVFGR